MRRAPLIALALVSVSCGRPAPAGLPPHPLVGSWMVTQPEGHSGVRVEFRVDSVARDSAYGALTFFLEGNAGFAAPGAWEPLAGVIRGDSVVLSIQAPPGTRLPSILLAGRSATDTVHLSTLRIGSITYPGTWLLVRPTAP